MEVTDPRCTFLTNQEVLSVLQNAKSSSREKHMRKHNTVVYEATKYLKSTPAASQCETDVKKLMSDLQNLFKLTPAEILQIVNLRPTTGGELATIIEEPDERFKDEQFDELIELILLNLPDESADAEGTVEEKETETVRWWDKLFLLSFVFK